MTEQATKQPKWEDIPKEQLKAVEFEGQNVIFAKDQPEYLPLPAFIDRESREQSALFCFAVDDYQRSRISKTGRIWIRCLTFGHPLQPLAVTVSPEVEGEEPDSEVIIQGRDEIRAEHPEKSMSNEQERADYITRHKTYLAEEIGRQMMEAGLIEFRIEAIPGTTTVEKLIGTVTVKKPTQSK